MSTIKDIAKELNISNATVSRALREIGYVRSELREKIFKTAKKLHYVPNAVAIGLRTRKTRIISLIVPYFKNPIFIDFLIYIEKFAYKDNYGVIFCITDEDIKIEEKQLRMLDMGLIDGAILFPCVRKDVTNEYIHKIFNRKIILVNRKIEGADFDIVQFNQKEAVYCAVKHFFKLGYKRIAAISGDLNTSVAKERFFGYKKAIDDFGLDNDNELIKYGHVSVENGFNYTIKLINMEKKPDAIISLNNIFTIGCLKAFISENKKLPDDIAFISMDDICNGDLIKPGITFIKQDVFTMAKLSYKMLSERLNEKKEGEAKNFKSMIVPFELVVRESCGYRKN